MIMKQVFKWFGLNPNKNTLRMPFCDSCYFPQLIKLGLMRAGS